MATIIGPWTHGKMQEAATLAGAGFAFGVAAGTFPLPRIRGPGLRSNVTNEPKFSPVG